MSNLINDMLWPLLVCFALVGIHAYLGIHVIARKVIFVDLALAQIAALGAVYGVFLGLSFESDAFCIKVISVSFTLLGALLFSFTRSKDSHIPHEAIIGIIYAIAMSLTILVTSNLPHGADEVRQMLAGSILWVTPSEVMGAFALYALIGMVHFFARKKFFLLSSEQGFQHASTRATQAWDFLFYATFGVVVTSSVGIAGVLLVFAYLIIPAVIGVMLAQSARARLLLGWAFGMAASIVGVIISYELDLPSGPVIVVILSIFLLLVAILHEARAKKAGQSLGLKIAFFLLPLLLVILLPAMFIKGKHDHEDHEPVAQQDDSDSKRHLSIAELSAAYAQTNDDFKRIEIANSLLALGDKRGFSLLEKLYASSDSDFAKDDIIEHLQEWLPQAPKNAADVISWFQRIEGKITYNKVENRFLIIDN